VQLVGGGIEPGDSLLQAAIREIEEETSWQVSADSLRLHGVHQMDVHPGELTFYIAPAPSGDVVVNDTEVAEVAWATTLEAARLAASPAASQFFASAWN
jgi:8-oxo-dGTP pyrophosphatase MutT (NUDIX family)